MAAKTPRRDAAVKLLARQPASLRLEMVGGIGAPDSSGRAIRHRAAVAGIAMCDPACPVFVTIDSPGGTVREAEEIAAALRAHPGRTVATVRGRCSSAATLILLACDERRAMSGATFRIHHATVKRGGRQTAEWHRLAADVLDGADRTLMAAYTSRTTAPPATLRRLMARDQTFDARRALALGFVHRILPDEADERRKAAARLPALMAKAGQRGLIPHSGVVLGIDSVSLCRRLDELLTGISREWPGMGKTATAGGGSALHGPRGRHPSIRERG